MGIKKVLLSDQCCHTKYTIGQCSLEGCMSQNWPSTLKNGLNRFSKNE